MVKGSGLRYRTYAPILPPPRCPRTGGTVLVTPPMVPIELLAGGALGAAGLLLILLRGGHTVHRTGGAIAALGGLAILAGGAGLGAPTAGESGFSFPLLVALLAGVMSAAGAVRVISSPRPVLAAIFFVLVVVAGCMLYLTLGAEFLAFALVIVYAGAILITYMFVLMLAQQASGDSKSGAAEYDRNARDPIAAVFVGLVLFLSIATIMWKAVDSFDPATTGQIQRARAWIALGELPKGLREAVESVEPGATPEAGTLHVSAGEVSLQVTKADGSRGSVTLPESSLPHNTQTVGVALVKQFPVSLELAGVILLMAMLGAVVLARRQIEIGDAQKAELHARSHGGAA